MLLRLFIFRRRRGGRDSIYSVAVKLYVVKLLPSKFVCSIFLDDRVAGITT